MPILSNIQSRLTALLLNILFIGTAVLGAVLIATQKLLAWLDGYHPQLNQASLVFQGWLKRYPKTIVASLASVLLVGGGGAFAVANLGPDIADQPVVNITVPVEIAQLESQAELLDQFQVNLTRSDQTRPADTPEALLRRLGLVDAEAAAFLRKHPLARQALRAGGDAPAVFNAANEVAVEASGPQRTDPATLDVAIYGALDHNEADLAADISGLGVFVFTDGHAKAMRVHRFLPIPPPAEEALEKLSKGMRVLIREGSVSKDLHALAGLLTERFSPYLAFCTDDRNPLDIGEHGHLDYMIRTAIQLGAPPLAAGAGIPSLVHEPIGSAS